MYKKGNITYTGGNIKYITDTFVFSGVPTEEQLISWGFVEFEDHIPTEEEILEKAKKDKLAEIEIYNDSDNVNSFTINNVPMWLDVNTRQQLRTSIEAYQAQGIENVTKWFNGVQFTFPTSAWLYMLNLLEVYASEALNVTEAHKAAINSLASIEDIGEYDFTSGYPNKVEL